MGRSSSVIAGQPWLLEGAVQPLVNGLIGMAAKLSSFINKGQAPAGSVQQDAGSGAVSAIAPAGVHYHRRSGARVPGGGMLLPRQVKGVASLRRRHTEYRNEGAPRDGGRVRRRVMEHVAVVQGDTSR